MELIDLRIPLASRGYEVFSRDGTATIYRRRGASIVDLAAEGKLAAAPERVQSVLIDYSRHASFVKGVAESRVLWRGSGQLLVYQRLDLPWLSDRDYTLSVGWGRRAGYLFVSFGCANQRGPAPSSGAVRVQVHNGGWLLQPALAGLATQARYQVQLDLGGSLPRWMARSGAGREIPALFNGIAQQARAR